MPTVAITAENIEETVRDNAIVVLDFWASWCGPCRAFAPVFDAAAEKHADIVFGKVDTEDQPALAGQLEIRSIPTLMVFRENIMLYRNAGAMREDGLEALIQQVRDVNMDEVRAELEAKSGEAAKG